MNTNIMKVIGATILIIVVAGAFYLLKGTSTPETTQQISLVTQPSPPQAGNNTFFITVRDDTGKAVDNAKVDFDLNMTTMNMGTQKGTATSQGGGRYAAIGRLTMRGPWTVSTTVTYADGKVVKKEFVVNLP